MIEHIEAYLKQHYCRDYFNTYGETVKDDHYFMYREEVDGLIELIVRECMSIIKQGDGLGNEDDFDKGFQAGIAMAYNRIRAQMGVEE